MEVLSLSFLNNFLCNLNIITLFKKDCKGFDHRFDHRFAGLNGFTGWISKDLQDGFQRICRIKLYLHNYMI